SILEPALSEKYPNIQTFTLKGIDNLAATGRVDVTPLGFHAYIQTPAGDVYIDPYSSNDLSIYISYAKLDSVRTPRPVVERAPTGRFAERMVSLRANRGPLDANIDLGAVKRTYQMVAVATGEFVDAQCNQDGVVCTNDDEAEAVAFAAIVTGMNRVNQVYEKELAITFELVEGTDQLMFANAALDPFTNVADVFALIDEGAGAVDGVIPIDNYDIGHVFGSGEDSGGGLAYSFSCDANDHADKTTGVTTLPDPVGDPFWVDYVAHEIGHQFFADHSYNASQGGFCTTRAGGEAYEPGSGSTIMSYVGICDDQNLQNQADAMFNAGAYNAIANFVTNGGGATCATLENRENTPPSVSAGADYTIPRDTSFRLTADVSDNEQSSAEITTSWEQYSLGSAWSFETILPNTDNQDNTARPILRVFLPSSSPTRIVPTLANILDGTYQNTGEDLPSISQPMVFRATARDNAAGAGGIASDDMKVTVDGNSGPFRVTSQATTASFEAGNTIIVEWDVAGTDQAPVSCSTVDIMISVDGGQTFNYLLEGSTANDGIHVDSVPISIQPTSEGRVQVKCSNNIFFDINKSNLTFTNANPNPFTDFAYIPVVVR
ncbi:MAG: zinc-dependent metalloprotease family protein, partial [Chloroflexota bacterium]